MKKSAIVRRATQLAQRYRIDDGEGFVLKSVYPADTHGMTDREEE